jgi:hypothetical protein
MSTWVLKEEINIHRKGKIMGISIAIIKMKKNNLKIIVFFTAPRLLQFKFFSQPHDSQAEEEHYEKQEH